MVAPVACAAMAAMTRPNPLFVAILAWGGVAATARGTPAPRKSSTWYRRDRLASVSIEGETMGTIRIGIITLLTIGQLAGSAVSVAAQDDEAVVVSGGMSPIGGASVPCELEEDFTELDDGTASWTWCFGLVMDDPRLTGDGSVVMAERAYDGFGLISSRVEIANEGGSWSGNGTRVFIDGDPGDRYRATRTQRGRWIRRPHGHPLCRSGVRLPRIGLVERRHRLGRDARTTCRVDPSRHLRCLRRSAVEGRDGPAA